MRKLLSILLSVVLCMSVLVTNLDNLKNPDNSLQLADDTVVESICEENYSNADVEPCDESFPPPGEFI